ncbi:hypothetical protein [Arthrobacter sp. NA-172]|uniref:hypothetical protein n=1 Tax=Arthrobacter sp. NA-172 TaxID=3367524 RepID=UPI003754C05E
MVVIPAGVIHDIVNDGEYPLTAIGFFANGVISSVFEEALMPSNTSKHSLP